MYWFPEEDIGTFKMSTATNSQGLEAITGWRGAGWPGEDFVHWNLGQMEQCFDTSLHAHAHPVGKWGELQCQKLVYKPSIEIC